MKLIRCLNCSFSHTGVWGDKELWEHQKFEEETNGKNWMGFAEDKDVVNMRDNMRRAGIDVTED